MMKVLPRNSLSNWANKAIQQCGLIKVIEENTNLTKFVRGGDVLSENNVAK